MRIGITGQQGFAGSHLKNFLSLQGDVTIIPFERHYFEHADDMQRFVRACDVIVHLAGMNRHAEPQVIYDTNVRLAHALVSALQTTGVKPHVLFASSTQESQDNIYGRSKREARHILEAWGTAAKAIVTSMIIPNVFGPFGKPFYNSVVATFCYQMSNGDTPQIHVDGDLKLIYINELVANIHELIKNPCNGSVNIVAQHNHKVSEILTILQEFKSLYLEKGTFPALDTPFRLALFNTFRCYIPPAHYPVPFTMNTDQRGTFVEIARANSAGQFSYSTTHPGVTRGNHFHTRKAERFAVIRGKARIDLRKIDTQEVISYVIDSETPSFVDMPIWHTHNITNIGTSELLTLFWINEPYNPEDPDTYFVNV